MEKKGALFLDYPHLFTCYEELNFRYRFYQRNLERAEWHILELIDRIQSYLPGTGNDPFCDGQILHRDLCEVVSRLLYMQNTADVATTVELSLINILQKKIAHVNLEMKKQDIEGLMLVAKKNTTNRFVADIMLRTFQVDAVRLFITETGFKKKYIYDFQPFVEAVKVLNDLQNESITSLFKWLNTHRHRMKDHPLLDRECRTQVAIELIRDGRYYDAVDFMTRYFSMEDMKNDDAGTDEDSRLKVWGLVVVGVTYPDVRYQDLLHKDRWLKIIALFSSEFRRLFKLGDYSNFAACFLCGVAAFRSPECGEDYNPMCPSCQPFIRQLGGDIPSAHSTTSRLFCAYSGELLNEDNPPWMAPSQRVYGEISLKKIFNSSKELFNEFGDIRGVTIDQCQRLFVV